MNIAKSGSDVQVLAILDEVIFKSDLWTPFIPLPCTADSAAGTTLAAALVQIKSTYPKSSLAQGFFLKFWRPEADAMDAAFVRGVRSSYPLYRELTPA
ncbi:MAG: hypothetical protein WCK46_01650 [Candidatus Adlerbacteria bacterium]